ncbi:hypothetical protein FACS189452_09170 [Bacteroidia bacterium]|nr:hypothetical protein FACS189452_09170 [Bacteroidia bacterium]
MKPITVPQERKPISEWRRFQQTQFFHEGKKQAVFGDADRAYTSFKVALLADRYCDACYYELASLYINRLNFGEALTASANAYRLDTANYWYAIRYAKLLATTRQYDAAEKMYWQCLAQQPKQMETYQDLLSLYEQQQNQDKTLALLDFYEKNFGQDVTSISTRQALFYKTGDFAKSLEQAILLAEQFPDKQPYTIMVADLYAQQGNDSLAFVWLQRAKQLDSTNIDYQMSLADYYRRNELFDDYFSAISQVFENQQTTRFTKLQILEFLQQFPQLSGIFTVEITALYDKLHQDSTKNYAADWLYAQFLLQTRCFDEAQTTLQNSLQRALTVAPHNKAESKALHTISRVFFSLLTEQRQWDSVIVYTEKYDSFLGKKHEIRYMKAFALVQKNEYLRAKNEIEQSLQYIEANDTAAFSQAYATLGDICFNLKEYSQSDKFYEKALKYTPRSVLLLNNYAYYLSLRGKKLDKALRMSQLVIDQEPENATYLDTYAWILYQQERYEEAKQVFRKAFVYNGDKEFTILEHYGDVLFQLGEKDNAQIYWRRSREHGNNSEELQQKIK